MGYSKTPSLQRLLHFKLSRGGEERIHKQTNSVFRAPLVRQPLAPTTSCSSQIYISFSFFFCNCQKRAHVVRDAKSTHEQPHHVCLSLTSRYVFYFYRKAYTKAVSIQVSQLLTIWVLICFEFKEKPCIVFDIEETKKKPIYSVTIQNQLMGA